MAKNCVARGGCKLSPLSKRAVGMPSVEAHVAELPAKVHEVLAMRPQVELRLTKEGTDGLKMRLRLGRLLLSLARRLGA